MNYESILKTAADNRMRLLIEVDLDGIPKVWYDPADAKDIKEMFKGVPGAVFSPVYGPIIRFPFDGKPTVTETPYSANEKTRPFQKMKETVTVGKVKVYGDPGIDLKQAKKDAMRCKDMRYNHFVSVNALSMADILDILNEEFGDKYWVNVSHDETYMYEKESRA